MFIPLSLVAMLMHARQTPLMATHYRRFDPLSACAVRGLSLGSMMLPLPLFAAPGEFALLFDLKLLIFFAEPTAAVGNWCAVLGLVPW